MTNLIKVFVVIVLVAFVAVLMVLLMPIPTILELFLLLLGILIIVEGGLVLDREVGKVMDLRHRQQIQRELRDLYLQRIKQQRIQPSHGYKRGCRGKCQS